MRPRARSWKEDFEWFVYVLLSHVLSRRSIITTGFRYEWRRTQCGWQRYPVHLASRDASFMAFNKTKVLKKAGFFRTIEPCMWTDFLLPFSLPAISWTYFWGDVLLHFTTISLNKLTLFWSIEWMFDPQFEKTSSGFTLLRFCLHPF